MTDSFLATEHVEGTNLGELLATNGPLPALTAARIAIDIASALASAQRWGILHDDLELTDIIITPSGRAKITDSATSYTVEAGDLIDPEGDLHSLGLLLLDMVEPEIPSGLSPIIHRLVSSDPAVSYTSTKEVEVDLHRFVSTSGGANYLPGGAPTGEVAAVKVDETKPPRQRWDSSTLATATLNAINPLPDRADRIRRSRSKSSTTTMTCRGTPCSWSRWPHCWWF
jgi:serine/threonine protein kinase